MLAHVGSALLLARHPDIILGDAGLPVFGTVEERCILANGLLAAPSKHGGGAGKPIRDAVVAVGQVDRVVRRGLDRDAEALLGCPQFVDLQEPVHDGTKDRGIRAQELRVGLVEIPRLGVVDLQEAVGSFAGQEDGHVQQRHDTLFLHEIRNPEARLLVDVLRADGPAGVDGVRLEGVFLHGNVRAASDIGTPADTDADEEGLPPFLDLQHLRPPHAQSLRNDPAGLRQHVSQIVRLSCKIAEVCEQPLALKQDVTIIFHARAPRQLQFLIAASTETS